MSLAFLPPLVRPSMLESTALGAAMAAGMAEGIDIWKLNEDQINDNATADVFVPSISESGEVPYIGK